MNELLVRDVPGNILKGDLGCINPLFGYGDFMALELDWSGDKVRCGVLD